MPNHPAFAHALDFVALQCRQLIEKYPGYTPMYTVGGKWRQEGERWTHWCEGFYPGIFWLLHRHTGDAFWRRHAQEYSGNLAHRCYDRTVHDLGFLFLSTYLRWYHAAPERETFEVVEDTLIAAGRTLALRRQMGGYLASFVGPESLFIDIMMNVGLILWAANVTGSRALREIALEHCQTTQQTLVRADGSTAHEGLFSAITGGFLKQTTHQGYRGDSTWTRGLAWAIYGFTAVHRLSGEAEFLNTARRCADCYLRRAPANLIPPWDFDAPADGKQPVDNSAPWQWTPDPVLIDGKQPLDSSAAAITASGLIDLAEAVPDAAQKTRYRGAALTILESLCGPEFLAESRPGWEGILLHGVYHLPKGLGVDESVAWGDHFFVEALVKALHGPDAAW